MSAASNFNSLTGNAMSHQRQAVGQGIQNLQLGPSSITNGAKIHSSISVVGLNVVYKPMETYAGVLGAILQQFGWRVLANDVDAEFRLFLFEQRPDLQQHPAHGIVVGIPVQPPNEQQPGFGAGISFRPGGRDINAVWDDGYCELGIDFQQAEPILLGADNMMIIALKVASLVSFQPCPFLPVIQLSQEIPLLARSTQQHMGLGVMMIHQSAQAASQAAVGGQALCVKVDQVILPVLDPLLKTTKG